MWRKHLPLRRILFVCVCQCSSLYLEDTYMFISLHCLWHRVPLSQFVFFFYPSLLSTEDLWKFTGTRITNTYFIIKAVRCLKDLQRYILPKTSYWVFRRTSLNEQVLILHTAVLIFYFRCEGGEKMSVKVFLPCDAPVPTLNSGLSDWWTLFCSHFGGSGGCLQNMGESRVRPEDTGCTCLTSFGKSSYE